MTIAQDLAKAAMQRGEGSGERANVAAARAVAATSSSDTLRPGQTILQGKGALLSKNGQYHLVYQTDGNMVLFRSGAPPYWASQTRGSGGRLTMQTDGNCVMYYGTKPVWHTRSNGHPGAYMVMQDDGNLVVYAPNRAPLWSSETVGGQQHNSSWLSGAIQTFGKGVTSVTQSSVWKAVAGLTVVIPGIGPAVSAGMITATALGKAASIKDKILGAARSLLPGGDAAKSGFDMAVGITINGQGMSSTLLKAARDQLPDGPAKLGFDTALSIHVGKASGATPQPGPPASIAAYYATKGLVSMDAPPAMKLAVAGRACGSTA